MRIGVVSDTHSRAIPRQLVDDFKKVDLIVHAGDFCSQKDLKKFTQLKEVKGVHGNMDDEEVKSLFPRRQMFYIEKCLIGIYHGEGARAQVLDFVKKEFAYKKPDIVIFGHSHCPLNECIDNVLYFNPGSPNDIIAPYCSYGILEIENGQINSSIIKIEE